MVGTFTAIVGGALPPLGIALHVRLAKNSHDLSLVYLHAMVPEGRVRVCVLVAGDVCVRGGGGAAAVRLQLSHGFMPSTSRTTIPRHTLAHRIIEHPNRWHAAALAAAAQTERLTRLT